MEKKADKSAWERWKELAAKAATWQARVLLGAFYWIVVSPFAIVFKSSCDILGLDKDSDSGHWTPCSDADPWEQY
ncbi:hypothetical protein IJT17_07720 [bacterium]|nr:hypothetical protein [bacterium]